jgi:phosphatidylglycerophosphate synthase
VIFRFLGVFKLEICNKPMKVSLEEIRNIQKTAKEESYYASIFSRKLALYFTWVLMRFGIGANGVTLLSAGFLVFGAYFFTFADPLFWIYGWLVLQIYHILDCSDGEVARLSGNTTKFGGMFDAILHPFGNSLVSAAVSIGLYNMVGDVKILYLGFFVAIFLLMMTVIRLHARLRTGKEKNYVIGDLSVKKGILWKLFAIFIEIGGPFNAFVVAALIEMLSGVNFRFYFFIFFCISVFLLFVKKLIAIKKDVNLL